MSKNCLPAIGGPFDGAALEIVEDLPNVAVPFRHDRYAMYERMIDRYEFRKMLNAKEMKIVKRAEE